MKSPPPAARIYVASIIVVGTVLVAWLGPRATFDQPVLFASLLVLSAVAAAFKISLPTGNGSTMSVSSAIDFATLIMLGPHAAMLVALVSSWAQCTFRSAAPNPLYRTLFSMAALAITVQAAGYVYLALGGLPAEFGHGIAGGLAPLFAAATTYFLVNTSLIAGAIGLENRRSPFVEWHQHFLWSAPGYFVAAAAAAVVKYALLGPGIWIAFVAVAPIFLTYRAYCVYLARLDAERERVQEISELHLKTLEALALAIDAKDQTSHAHLRRVQMYATNVARAIGMSERDIEGLQTAALLHDVGKLAVPEHILSKPGPLTQEEFQRVRLHPAIGAEIISSVPFPYPVGSLILSHHERWDGKGYPQGLKATAIPLGARILSVVDYFDALTSDRPYHKAMTHEAATVLISQEAGKALDPAIVKTFLDLLPRLSVEAEQLERSVVRQPYSQPVVEAARSTKESKAVPKGSSVFDDIAYAHREIYALYQIAQTMGTSLGVSDTMALIASKLTSLVPFTSCALFLYDEDTETVRCRFATGAEAETLGALSMACGQGLIGWVARNRRPLVNGRPSADFEAGGLTARSTTLQSALISPLLFNDRFIGTLVVYHVQPDFYTEDHRRLIDRVAEQASAVIHNALVFEQTQEDSLTDPLTGLPNTRFMFMHLTRELARAERLKSEVALLVMDLDNFKDINDNHGHHIGDRALREVATVLRSAIRPYDICVRYAGDEFIVVLSGCGHDEAERKCLELQRAVDQAIFEARPTRRIPLAVSVGSAIYPQDGDSYEALLATADSRMYRDKAKRKERALRQAAATGTDGAAVIVPIEHTNSL